MSCILIFAFALVRDGRGPEDGAAGLLWIAIAFAGTLALGRTFERERQSETLRALLMAPTARPAVYVGKLLGIVALLRGRRGRPRAAGGAAASRRAGCWSIPFWLAAILAAGTIGFASVGTLFAAMLIRARSRDVLLPVLLYPVIVPVMIAAVRGTAVLLQPEIDDRGRRVLAGAADDVRRRFVTLALWTFEAGDDGLERRTPNSRTEP